MARVIITRCLAPAPASAWSRGRRILFVLIAERVLYGTEQRTCVRDRHILPEGRIACVALEEIDPRIAAPPEAENGLERFVATTRAQDAQKHGAYGDRAEHDIPQSIERELELESQKAQQQVTV